MAEPAARSPTRTRCCSTPRRRAISARAPRRTSPRASGREAITYVPMAVVWECSLLARAVRINLRRSTRAFFDDLFSNPAYQPLDLTYQQVATADELRFTRDPFDALIAAAAIGLGLPLLTRDRDIGRAGVVRTIW